MSRKIEISGSLLRTLEKFIEDYENRTGVKTDFEAVVHTLLWKSLEK